MIQKLHGPRLKRLLSTMFLSAAAALVSACQTSSVTPQEVSLAIENVTVIDPEARRVLPNHSVYVDGDRIVAVVPRASKAQLTARRTLDGTGRFLIPGLMDMHVHLFLPNPAAASLNLLLANGVTGIREMSSDCWAIAGMEEGCVGEYRKLQSQTRTGEIAGPDLLGLTSTMVMGPTRLKLPENLPSFITPTTAADARTLVGYLSTRGVDLIKTHDSIPTAAFLGLMEEASRLGIWVGGHVPFGVTSLGAAQLGYRSIEHARDLLYDCSRYGPQYRRQETAFAEGAAGSKRPSQVDRLERTVEEFDPALCASFMKQLAATGVYYTPTHVTREMEARADEPSYRSYAERKYVLADRDASWEADLNETASLPPEQRSGLDRFFTHGLLITGLAHGAGVQVMAGTDANDTMIVPGYSLHRELGLLQAAGLSNMEVLRAATTVPAAYLERTRDLGGISVGKEADLVLLRLDPLRNISNTASIDAVVANGRVFGRAELDLLLHEVERLASESRQKG